MGEGLSATSLAHRCIWGVPILIKVISVTPNASARDYVLLKNCWKNAKYRRYDPVRNFSMGVENVAFGLCPLSCSECGSCFNMNEEKLFWNYGSGAAGGWPHLQTAGYRLFLGGFFLTLVATNRRARCNCSQPRPNTLVKQMFNWISFVFRHYLDGKMAPTLFKLHSPTCAITGHAKFRLIATNKVE